MLATERLVEQPLWVKNASWSKWKMRPARPRQRMSVGSSWTWRPTGAAQTRSMADSMEDWPLPAAITTFADGDPAENGWVSGAPPVEAIEIAAYSPEWPVLFEASK